MNEETFNMQLRKFLKTVGVTTQREIEKAVRDALDDGRLSGDETLRAEAVVTVAGIDLSVEIDGAIALEE
jgi:hypothetical protein